MEKDLYVVLLLFNRWWFPSQIGKSESTYKAVSNHHSAALFTLFSKKTLPSFCSSDTRFQAVFSQGSQTNFWASQRTLSSGVSFHSGFRKCHFVLFNQGSLAGYIMTICLLGAHSQWIFEDLTGIFESRQLCPLGAIFTVVLKDFFDPIFVG